MILNWVGFLHLGWLLCQRAHRSPRGVLKAMNILLHGTGSGSGPSSSAPAQLETVRDTHARVEAKEPIEVD